MPKISVIVPVYNVAQYLEECLQSLSVQTMTDAEYILIDDGSTDESGAICDRWAAQDSRFRVAHKENGGVSSARNLGLEMAQGEYIGFADGDDWLEPDALEHLSGLLDENPQAAVACAAFFEYMSDADNLPQIRPDSPIVQYGCTDRITTIRNMLVRQGYWATLWNKLFRRSAFEIQNRPLLFDTNLHYGEDENWVLNVVSNVDLCVCSDTPVYHYRSRPSSISHHPRLTDRVLSILDAYTASIHILRAVSSELELLAYGRIYNDTFLLQVRAYCNDQQDMLPYIRKKLKGTWMFWLRSPYVLALRKAKVMVVRTMMALHMPKAWVRYAFDIKRNQKESQEHEV